MLKQFDLAFNAQPPRLRGLRFSFPGFEASAAALMKPVQSWRASPFVAAETRGPIAMRNPRFSSTVLLPPAAHHGRGAAQPSNRVDSHCEAAREVKHIERRRQWIKSSLYSRIKSTRCAARGRRLVLGRLRSSCSSERGTRDSRKDRQMLRVQEAARDVNSPDRVNETIQRMARQGGHVASSGV